MKEYFKDITRTGTIVYYCYDCKKREWYIRETNRWVFSTDDNYFTFKAASSTQNALIPVDEEELMLELL